MSVVLENMPGEAASRFATFPMAMWSTQRRVAALLMMISMALMAPLMCDLSVSTSVTDS